MQRKAVNKIIIRIIICVVALFILYISIMYHACKIDSIYIAHMEMGKVYVQYKVDLVNNMYWENRKEYPVGEDCDDRFVLVTELEKEAVIGFRFASLFHGINFWKEQYLLDGVYDGHQWKMIITYSDGREKCIYGSNSYPSTYEELKQDFINLTGQDILKKLEIHLPLQIWEELLGI